MFNAPIKPLVVPENQPASNQNLFEADVELKDFFEPFILSRRATNCKKATIQFYQWHRINGTLPCTETEHLSQWKMSSPSY